MRMVDMHNEVIQACYQFTYKGYTISTSNIMNPKVLEVGFWAEETTPFQMATSIPEAMDKIDTFTGEMK